MIKNNNKKSEKIIRTKQLDVAKECYLRNPCKCNEFALYNANKEMGLLLSEQNEIIEAVKCFDNALEIINKMYTENPERYYMSLASLYSCMAFSVIKENKESRAYYIKAIEIMEPYNHSTNKQHMYLRCTILCNLASTYIKDKEFCMAEKNLLEGIEFFKDFCLLNGDDTKELLSEYYTKLYCVYFLTENNKDAKKYLANAINLREDLYSKNANAYGKRLYSTYCDAIFWYNKQSDSINIRKYIAKVSSMRSILDDEEPDLHKSYWLNSMKIREMLYSKDSKIYNKIDTTLSDSAFWYYKSKDIDSLLIQYLKVQAILEDLFTSDSEEYGRNLDILYFKTAFLYAKKTEYQKAEEYFLKSIGINEILYVANSEKYANSLFDRLDSIISACIFSDYDFREYIRGTHFEEKVYNKMLLYAKEENRKSPGKHNIKISKIYEGLASTNMHYKNYSEAKKLYLEELKIIKKLNKESPGKYDVKIKDANNSLLYIKQIETENAEKINACLRSISSNKEIYDAITGAGASNLSKSYFRTAEEYKCQNQYKKAEEYCIYAREIIEKFYLQRPAEFENEFFDYTYSLAHMYLEEKNYNEAEKYFKKSEDILKLFSNKNCKEKHIRLINRLIACYLHLHDLENAHKYIQKYNEINIE